MKAMNRIIAGGIARDCDSTVRSNVIHVYNIIKTIAEQYDVEYYFFVFENDSVDQTSHVLNELSAELPMLRVKSVNKFSAKTDHRIDRIAKARDELHQYIFNTVSSKEGYLLLVDLDDEIGASLTLDGVSKSLEKMEENDLDGIFPISHPYYYDIFALRAKNWLDHDYREYMQYDRDKYGYFGSIFLNIISKQRHISTFLNDDLIAVDSAFGGAAIYRMQAIKNLTYYSSANRNEKVCEHVIFNKKLKKLAIYTGFVVKAPLQHLEYQTMSKFKFLRLKLFSDLSDFKSYIYEFINLR